MIQVRFILLAGLEKYIYVCKICASQVTSEWTTYYTQDNVDSENSFWRPAVPPWSWNIRSSSSHEPFAYLSNIHSVYIARGEWRWGWDCISKVHSRGTHAHWNKNRELYMKTLALSMQLGSLLQKASSWSCGKSCYESTFVYYGYFSNKCM